MAQYQLVTCTINGKKSEKMVDVRASLTDMLRNDYRLTSVKKGCEVGECGACTALINGEAINTCLYLAVWAEGKDIITTTLPLIVGFLLAKRAFKLQPLNNLGSLTGGMTSTPALGTLVAVSGTDDVAAAYAATYPVALVLIVLASNLIGTFIP